MQASPLSNTAARAFRIYLTYTLHETEELLAELEFRASTVSSALCSTSDSPWTDVIESTKRVITYITNCQSDDEVYGFFVRGFYGLSAISAAQDALRDIIVWARANHNPTPVLRITEHTFRAKCIVNSIVALNAHDHDLSALWIQAAQHLSRRSSNTTNKPAFDPTIARRNLTKAQSIEAGLCDQNDPVVAELTRLVARSHRVVAACSVGISTFEFIAHETAGHTYEFALNLHIEGSKQTSLTAAGLWQRAVSSLRLAADMSVQEGDDSLIRDAYKAANRLASDARLIPEIEKDQKRRVLEIDEAALKIASHKHPVAVSLWSALKTELEKNHTFSERHLQLLLQGEGHDSETSMLNMQFSASIPKMIKDTAQKVEASILSSAFFKKKGQQCISSPHTQLHALLQRCWTLAATHMDNAIQHYGDYVVDGTVKQVHQLLVKQQHKRAHAADEAVYVAESILGRAASHLDAARGAEAAGRDPREAKHRRAAAECLIQTAEHVCNSIETDMANLIEVSYVAKDVLVIKKIEEENSLISSAEYLLLANQQRKSPSSPHSARIADLYCEVAGLVLHKAEREILQRKVDFSVDFIVGYIDRLHSKNVSDKEVELADRGCVYARELCKAVQKKCLSFGKWFSALKSIEDSIAALACQDQMKPSLLSARAAVYEQAARESLNTSTSKERSSVYMCAAEELSAALEVRTSCVPLMAYHLSLAARILSAPGENMTPLHVPKELLEIQFEETLGDVQQLLASHARACRLRVTCDRRSSSSRCSEDERKAWKFAHNQVYTLVAHYQSQAKAKYLFITAIYPESSNAAQELVVESYMGAARSVGKPALAALWRKAVLQCNKTATLGSKSMEQKLQSVALTKQLIRDARAAEQLQFVTEHIAESVPAGGQDSQVNVDSKQA